MSERESSVFFVARIRPAEIFDAAGELRNGIPVTRCTRELVRKTARGVNTTGSAVFIRRPLALSARGRLYGGAWRQLQPHSVARHSW